MRDGRLGQSQRFDFTLRAHLLQLSDLIGERDVWVNSVQVVKVDGIDAKSAQAKFNALAQVGWYSARCPLARALAREPTFRCNDQIIREGVQSFADQCFDIVRAIGIGSVDMLNA
ncbi:hypothetical protein PFUM301597_16260 [Pseudomonas fluorescens]